MQKKSQIGRPARTDPTSRNAFLNSHHISPKDLFLYAWSFHKAAKTLAASFQADANSFVEADASAVVFMYRQALELHLKAIVLGEGGEFLPTKPEPISVSKTHSVSWLAQFVCQIISALKWEKEFRCEGIETLSDFKAVIEQVNAVDPGSYDFGLPVDPKSQASVRDFGGKMDALLELVDSTADALAAERDMLSEAAGTKAMWKGGGFKPMIQ